MYFSFHIGIPEEDIAYIFGNPDILEDNIRPDQQAASSCMSANSYSCSTVQRIVLVHLEGFRSAHHKSAYKTYIIGLNSEASKTWIMLIVLNLI